MKPFYLALILFCTGIEAFASPSSDTQSSPTSVRVLALSGPSGVGLSRCVDNPITLSGTKVSTDIVPSVDILLPQLLNGDAIAGVLPPNVAAKLYNRSPGSIMVCAIIGNGMLSVLSTNPSVQSFDDLANETLYSTGSGSTPEYLFSEIIARQNNDSISPIIDFSLPPAEIAVALVSGKIKHALLPEPFATVALMKASASKRPVYRAISPKEVGTAAGFELDYPMTVFVVRGDFAKKHREILRGILAEVQASIEWVGKNPSEAGRVAERAGLGISASVTEKSIPECNLVYIPANEAHDSIERLLSVFLARSPESIGGVLPDGGFYIK